MAFFKPANYSVIKLRLKTTIVKLQVKREQWLAELQEDLADVNFHISFKEMRLRQAEIVKDYKQCDRITEECKVRKRDLESELNLLTKKDKKARKRV